MSYTSTAAFRRAILTSHNVASGCDLYPAAGPAIYGIPVVGGHVRIDNSASERRTTAIDLAGADLIPEGALNPLSPYGAEVRPWRGITYPDGSTEIMPLGVFRISTVSVKDDGTPSLSIEGSDRSRPLSRNKFVDPYVVPAGRNYATAIGELVQNRMPGVDMALAETAETTPLLVYDTEDDPWDHILEMAKAIGFEALFDADGQFVLRPQPDPSDDQPLARFVEGADSVLLSLDRGISDDPGYNGVVMRAESTTLPAPLRSVVWDLDPTSPTFADGPYGRVPAFQSSPYIATQTACDAAARAWLVKNLGGTDSITLSAVPDPSLDASDVAVVRRAASKVDQASVIEALTIPLEVDSDMSVTLRTRQLLVAS